MRKVLPILLIVFMTVPASAKVFVAKDGTGTYIGGLPDFYTDDAVMEGTPSMTQDGHYVDGTVKEIAKKDTWQKIVEAIDLQFSASQDNTSQK